MRIGIDARLYGEEKNKGIGRYVAKLLDNLQVIDKENEYFVFLQSSEYDIFSPTGKNFTKVKVDITRYSFAEQIIWPRIINRYKLDVMHFTHFNVPFFYKGNSLVTIHDLIMTHYNEDRSTTKNKFLFRIKIGLARFLVNRVARQSRLILTPSLFSKQDIVNKLGVSSDKIIVTAEAVDTDSQEITAARPSAVSQNEKFFLYVGAAYPHKNLDFLVAVWKKFNKNKNWNLFLVGRHDFFYQRLSEEKIKSDGSIRLLGSLKDAELKWLYSQAYAFIFPSLLEGFGLPPLEAMNFGCPVLASNSSSLPGVLGDAPFYFDPKDEDSLLQALQTITNQPQLRSVLRTRGLAQVKKYSWARLAKETKAGYDFVNR